MIILLVLASCTSQEITGRVVGVQQAQDRLVTSDPVNIHVNTIDDGPPPGTPTVTNMAALKALSPGQHSQVWLEGYYTPQDGGQGLFQWNPTSTQNDNAGTIIIPNSNPSQGRWIRDTSTRQYVNARWFGFHPSRSGLQNKDSFDMFRDYVVSRETNRNGYIPAGTYMHQGRLMAPTGEYNNTKWFGDGFGLPIYRTNFGGNADIIWVATEKDWNDFSVEYTKPQANNAQLSLSFSNNKLTVRLGTDSSGSITTTANDIIKEVRRVDLFPEDPFELQIPERFMVYLPDDSDGTGVVSALPEQDLVMNPHATIIRSTPDAPLLNSGKIWFPRLTREEAGGDLHNFFFGNIEIDGNNRERPVNGDVAATNYKQFDMHFKNVYMHSSHTTLGDSVNSQSNFGFSGAHNTLVENALFYDSGRHGIGYSERDNDYQPAMATFRNIYVRRNGLRGGSDYGIDNSRGTGMILEDAYIAYNPQAHKTSFYEDSAAPHGLVKMDNVLFRENVRAAGGGVVLQQTGIGTATEEAVYELDNILIITHPNSGALSNIETDVRIGKVRAITHGQGFSFGGPLTVDELYVDGGGLRLLNGNRWLFSRPTNINYIYINGHTWTTGSSVRAGIYYHQTGQMNIKEGIINTNEDYGIFSRNDRTIKICPGLEFNNNIIRDIHQHEGTLTLIHEGLSGITHNAGNTIFEPC